MEKKAKAFSLGLALVLILSGVYLLIYNGFWLSNDELYLLDSTESVARRGNIELSYTFNLQPVISDDGTPDRGAVQEPLQPILAAPLYWLAQQFPNIGMAHTVWLFNMIVTIATAWLIYYFALTLGYSATVSLKTGLVYGLATLALPYAVTFFREPLFGFFLLGCFASSVHIQRAFTQQRSLWVPSILFTLSFVGGLLTKSFILVFMPSFIILWLPSRQYLKNLRPRRIAWVIAAFVFILIGSVSLFTFDLGLADYRYSFSYIKERLELTETEHIIKSLLGYQVSFGRSFWLYSPILLLNVVGVRLLLKRGEWRLIMAAVVGFILSSIGYAVIQRVLWWGGWGWGPRYMLPLVPIFTLGLLPVFEKLQNRYWGGWRRWAIAMLLLVSIGLQFLGIGVELRIYYETIESAGIHAWRDGLWTWEWSPINQHLRLWDWHNLNIATEKLDTEAPVPISIFMFLIILIGIIHIYYALYNYWWQRGFVAVLGCGLCLAGGALRIYSVQTDWRYIGGYPDLMILLEALDMQASSDDVIFIQNEEFLPAFINYFKTPALIITLPYAPGERHSPDMIPEVVSDDLTAQTGYPSARIMQWEGERHQRIWLVTSYSHLNFFTIRPSERFLVENYYPVREIYGNPTVENPRAVLFDSTPSPLQLPPSMVSGAVFAEMTALDGLLLPENKVELVGLDLPNDTTYPAGAIVPISLIWRPITPFAGNYNFSPYSLSVQIADLESGRPVAFRDGIPQGKFGYMSRWIPNNLYWDNHGIALPMDLAPGVYTVQIIIYNWNNGARFWVYDANGIFIGDWLRPLTITVRS